MRDILFKAKTESGRWIEGDLIRYESGEMAILEKPFSEYGYEATEISKRTKVIPDTLCQYTGLTDKNGNKIWENDIIGYWDTYSTENGRAEADCIGKVLWDDETLSFQVTERLSAESYEVMDECSVIGNIFDNPELLNN